MTDAECRRREATNDITVSARGKHQLTHRETSHILCSTRVEKSLLTLIDLLTANRANVSRIDDRQSRSECACKCFDFYAGNCGNQLWIRSRSSLFELRTEPIANGARRTFEHQLPTDSQKRRKCKVMVTRKRDRRLMRIAHDLD